VGAEEYLAWATFPPACPGGLKARIAKSRTKMQPCWFPTAQVTIVAPTAGAGTVFMHLPLDISIYRICNRASLLDCESMRE
jgi:hypothetical protein